MVKIKSNIVTKGWSGKLGNDIVFRKRGDRTYVAMAPETSNRVLSEKQKAHQLRFKLAIAYAKAQMADDSKKAFYDVLATEHQSPFNLAVSDYLRPPTVSDVDIGAYTGTVNDVIKVEAYDHFIVESVELAIYDSSDNLVESGSATLNDAGTHWEYKATVAHSGAGKVLATATDHPGNKAQLEVSFS